MAPLTDAARLLVEEKRYAVLPTHNADGSIHLTPVWHLFESGRFYVQSLSSDRKTRNVASHPDAAIIVEVHRLGAEWWLYASGAAEIRAGEEARVINARISQCYLTHQTVTDAQVGPAFAAAMAVTICVTPVIWRSSSFQALDQQFLGCILETCAEGWFLPVEL